MRHYMKRIYDIDIKLALSRETIPKKNKRWTEKEPEIRQDFIWGAGSSAIETINKGEFNTDPDTINTEKPNATKRNTYHSRRDFEQHKTKKKHQKNTGGN